MAAAAEATLRGLRVVITRPRDAAQRLSAQIAALGGVAIEFPTLEMVALPIDTTSVTAARDSDVWIFVSQHAVDYGAPALRTLAADTSSKTIIAVGPTTQHALHAAGFGTVVMSEDGYDSEAMLALPQLRAGAAQRVVIVRGRGGRETLRAGLEARGMQVRYLECYERSLPCADAKPLLAEWRAGKVHAVSVMSVQTLENFLTLVGAAGAQLLRATPLLVPHERIAAAARDLGFTRSVVTGIGDDALLRAMAAGVTTKS